MPDDTNPQGQIDPQAVMDEEKQPSAMPTEEKPADDLELPDGVSERTAEQFNKLKEQLRLEREEKEALRKQVPQQPQPQSVFDDLMPSQAQFPNLNPQQVQAEAQKFVDENGYVDVDALNKSLKVMNDLLLKTQEEQRLTREQVRKMEEKEQIRRAHAEYPQLDPHSESFDPRFYDLVKNELIGQMMKGEQDVLKAAKKASSLYTPQDVSKAKEEAVAEYKQKTTKRDQANPIPGSGKGKQVEIDHNELVRRSQLGDRDAIYKRLQASNY